ncbi:MAG: C-terminal binding protein [Propionibacteriaceae bacterium]|jgi:D-3-phosphoglycerate dehydrogenase|nr:C-terminal binding protein [Propionibacteriaceae bacterium]
MSRVVVTDHPFKDTIMEQEVAASHGAEFLEVHAVSEDETISAVQGANVVLVDYAPITRPVLETLAPGAAVIRYGVGYDNIDVAAAKELGITAANVRGYGTATVADHAAALILATTRRLYQQTEALKAGSYPAPWAFGNIKEVGDHSVGLVGVGKIGLALAKRVQAFGCQVLAYDPYANVDEVAAEGIKLTTLEEVFSSDVISLHLPLTKDTEHLIRTETIAQMKPEAVIVNTARGGLVNTVDLAQALREGRLAAAGLDVFENEPLPADSELFSLDNVILTPHMAFYSEGSIYRLQRMAADDAARALEGKPLLGAL